MMRAEAQYLPIRSSSVGLIVTSPPYFRLRRYDDDAETGMERSVFDYLDALIAFAGEAARVLIPTGNLWVNLGDRYSNRSIVRSSSHRAYGRDHNVRADLKHSWVESRELGLTTLPVDTGIAELSLLDVPSRFAIRCVDELGLLHRGDVVWHRPNGVGDPSNRGRVARNHELFMHFAISGDHYGPPKKNPHRSVWTIPVSTGARRGSIVHTASFPDALVSPLIGDWSRPGDVVLDPFSGSGTVPRIANALGRFGLGIDRSAPFAAMTRAAASQ